MDNPLKKILDSASGLFSGGGSSDSAVGIDIGSSAIKVVEIKKKKGKAVLETYGSIALGPYGGLDIGRVASLQTEKIVEYLSNCELSDVRKRCKEWNDDPIIKFL